MDVNEELVFQLLRSSRERIEESHKAERELKDSLQKTLELIRKTRELLSSQRPRPLR